MERTLWYMIWVGMTVWTVFSFHDDAVRLGVVISTTKYVFLLLIGTQMCSVYNICSSIHYHAYDEACLYAAFLIFTHTIFMWSIIYKSGMERQIANMGHRLLRHKSVQVIVPITAHVGSLFAVIAYCMRYYIISLILLCAVCIAESFWAFQNHYEQLLEQQNGYIEL